MSAHSSPSPSQGSTPEADEAKLPQGQCRYILLTPEIKGHRCGCVGFTLNRSLPGVTCECGHLSCYHLKGAEEPPDKAQLGLLLRRIQVLEEQLDRENQGGLGSALGDVVRRLGDLEEQQEKGREEFGQENRNIYRQISRVWQSVDQIGRCQAEIQSRLAVHDERFDEHEDNVKQLEGRLMESDDAAIDLEERVDRLEDLDLPASQSSRPPSNREGARTVTTATRALSRSNTTAATSMGQARAPSRGADDLAGNDGLLRDSGPWTVHVSLMPMASVAFPFEKDTSAYKRCLSRGLHQMIAVQGTDSASFEKAIATAFGSLLQGRPWMPLQAQLCEAETLLGLPMLRPLDASMIATENYNQDFLRKHCAVCGRNGKLESLYIAMQSDTFSWHFLRRSPCHLQGLEGSWAYDALLDQDDTLEDDSVDEGGRPSAGDILPQSLKRTAAEISRAPSFSAGSAGEVEGSRPKVARTGTCVPVPLEVRRRVEKV